MPARFERWLPLGLAVLWSCADPTQVLVWAEIAAGSQVAASAVALRVEVLDGDGAPVLDQTRPLSELSLPASVSLVPKQDDDPSRTFRVLLHLLGTGDVEIARQVAEGAFVRHAIREIHLLFDDSCKNVACGDGRTCIDGACQRACFTPTLLGQVKRSPPGVCPCNCTCAGDTCKDGVCIPARPVAAISAGHTHACALTAAEEVLCWGDNGHGQLGSGDLMPRDRPNPVALPRKAKAIAAGAAFTCAALEDGTVECWGEGAAGQLGPIANEDQPAPVPLLDANHVPVSGVVALGAGGVVDPVESSAHACAVRSGGDLLCWGHNEYGQLGTGTTEPRLPPTRVMTTLAGDDMAEVVLGGFHTCGRQRIGRLWCWGRDHDWQLGFPDQTDRSSPDILTGPPSPFKGVTAASAGTWHSCGIAEDSKLWCWGEDSEWRTGVPSDAAGDDIMMPTMAIVQRSWSAVAAGHRHTCAIDSEHTLWCFGTSAEGELGVRTTTVTSSPPLQIREQPWDKIALGTSFSCGIQTGGALYCWGRNSESQLGVGGQAGLRTPGRVCLP